MRCFFAIFVMTTGWVIALSKDGEESPDSPEQRTT